MNNLSHDAKKIHSCPIKSQRIAQMNIFLRERESI